MVPIGALALALLLAQSASAPASDYLAQGVKALDANQPATAEPLLRKAVAAEPASVEANFNLALVLGMEGKDAEAIAAYRKTLELQPAIFEADLNLGILLLRDKQPAEAAVALREAAGLKPGEYRPQLFCGNALYDSGEYEEAERYFRKALALNAQSAPANLGIARSLLKESKLAEAEPYYRTAGSLDPAAKSALIELGAEYDKKDQSAEAIAIFREFPANDAVAKRLTQLLMASSNAAAAVPNLEAAVKRSPTTENRLALADAYRQTGQKSKVLEQLQLALAADAANFDVHMSYGRMLRDDRKFLPAAGEFQAASKLRPDSVPALNELAGVLILAGLYDDGLAALDRVKALGKEIPGDMYLRAITLDRLHRNQPALDAYRQFLSVAGGKFPDQEFLARQRARIIERELGK